MSIFLSGLNWRPILHRPHSCCRAAARGLKFRDGKNAGMDEKLWSGPGNPSNEVASRLGMPRWLLGDRLHAIKEAWGLGGADRVTIWRSGKVTKDDGEEIGNLHDED
jgi:hypothetical protein